MISIFRLLGIKRDQSNYSNIICKYEVYVNLIFNEIFCLRVQFYLFKIFVIVLCCSVLFNNY